MTPEEYLEIERKAEFKSEFHDGVMIPVGLVQEYFARNWTQESHSLVIANLGAELRQQFRGRLCKVFHCDMQIQVGAADFAYPDLVAVCGQAEFADRRKDTLLNSGLIIEVVSPSTEAVDRGRKRQMYGRIGSLREYVVVAPDRIHVDFFTRHEDGWILSSFDKAEDSLKLASVGAEVRLADIYEKVEFQSI